MSKAFSSLWTASAFKGAFRYLKKHPVSENNSETLGKSRHKTVRKHTLPRKFDGIEIVWKEYENTRFWRFFLRPSFAEREFQGYRIAEKLGISVPKVLAYGDTRSCFKLKSCFVVTEFLQDARIGSPFCPDGALFRDTAKKAYCKQTLQYLAQLHHGGYVHGSLLPGNVLWRLNRDSRLEVFFVDPGSIRARSGRRLRKGIRNDLRMFLGILGFDPETAGQMVNYYNRIRKTLSPDAKPVKL